MLSSYEQGMTRLYHFTIELSVAAPSHDSHTHISPAHKNTTPYNLLEEDASPDYRYMSAATRLPLIKEDKIVQ
jgi:hypothetical protein